MRQQLVGSVCLVLSVVNHLSDVFYRLKDSLTLIELDAFLSVIAISDGLTCHYSSRIRRLVAGDHIEEGRFSYTILADNADAFAFLEDIFEVFKHDSITV